MGKSNSIQNVVVTGGSSGIGLACAKLYASRGCNVALVARDGKKLAAAKELLERELLEKEPSQGDSISSKEKAKAPRVVTISADLSNEESTRAAFGALIQIENFVPDLLINSAGVIIPGEFCEMSSEDFEANLDCGFWTVVNPCKVVAPLMKEMGGGHIVNVSSVAGYMGVYGYTGYSAAKFATLGFTEALRSEMKPEGVSVSVVCPPDTKTPGLDYEKTLRPPETDAIAGSLAPVEPEVIAHAIARGVEKDKYLIIPGFTSKLYFRIKGILPELVFAVTDSDVRKARKAGKKRGTGGLE